MLPVSVARPGDKPGPSWVRGRPATHLRPPLEPVSQHRTLVPSAPPPPPSDEHTITLFKKRGVPMGVKFFTDTDQHGRGAEIRDTDAYGTAWRAGLRWGDVLVSVKVFSQLRPGEVLSEHNITDGLSAAKALRPATGVIELQVIRRRHTARDAAASRIQSAWSGHQARWTMRVLGAAATTIARHLRGWRARNGVVARLKRARGERRLQQRLSRARELARQHDGRGSATIRGSGRRQQQRQERAASGANAQRARSALVIQSAWRRRVACLVAWERLLALTYLQEQLRAWLTLTGTKRRTSGSDTERAGIGLKRACVRQPPRLLWDDEDEDDVEAE